MDGKLGDPPPRANVHTRNSYRTFDRVGAERPPLPPAHLTPTLAPSMAADEAEFTKQFETATLEIKDIILRRTNTTTVEEA